MADVERSGGAPRVRLSVDITAKDLEELKREAREQGISDRKGGAGVYARKILLERHEKSVGDRLNEAFNQLSEASVNIILKNQSGEQILDMPAALFRTLLESDPALINHFIRQTPSKP